jgi:hypothetical protein
MWNTRVTAAVPVLRQRVCLFAPSVTVCAMVCVCVRLLTCVPADSYSAELWRFCTSTRGWERVDITTPNGAGPSGRYSHVMTSVGLDLWMHGGLTRTGEGDSCGTHVSLLLLPC